MIMLEATQWLENAKKAGLSIEDGAQGNVEVSFLLSYAGENLNQLATDFDGSSIGGKGGFLDHEGQYCHSDE